MSYLQYEVDTPLSHLCCTRDHSLTRRLVKLPSTGLLLTHRLVKVTSTAAAQSIRRLQSISFLVSRLSVYVPVLAVSTRVP